MVACGLAAKVSAVCNTAPTAADDRTSVYFELIVIDPLVNDTDAEGQALTVTIQSSTCNGAATLDDFGLVSFDPAQPVTASCQINYRVSDELGLGDTATIFIDPAPQPPQIYSDGFETGNTSRWSACEPNC